MGIALAGIGGLLSLVGAIWIIVIAFQNGDIVWGVLAIFCGIVGLIYALQHMEQAKIPLILMIVGIVLSIVGQVMGGMAMVEGM